MACYRESPIQQDNIMKDRGGDIRVWVNNLTMKVLLSDMERIIPSAVQIKLHLLFKRSFFINLFLSGWNGDF